MLYYLLVIINFLFLIILYYWRNNFNVFRLLHIQIIFMIFGIIMGLFAIMLLTFGFLATGMTRQNIYANIRCIIGGRVSAIFVWQFFSLICCFLVQYVLFIDVIFFSHIHCYSYYFMLLCGYILLFLWVYFTVCCFLHNKQWW